MIDRITCIAAVLLLCACGGDGGGGGGGGSLPAPAPPANTLAIVVDGGPGRVLNLAFATVTVCSPGSASCQTVDHVLIDSGSSGLRILSSALAPPVVLPQQNTSGGQPLAECAQFADGSSWGPIKLADVTFGVEKANSVAVQIIGDPAFSVIPASCSSTGPAKNSLLTLKANGILGVGTFRQDCGPACVQSGSPGFYFACPPAGCQPVALPLAEQLQNPVTLFAVNNNGVVIDLPAVGPAGAPGVAGTLTFGVGTQANNGLGGASILGLAAGTGYFTTSYGGRTYTRSFLDSGSNGLFFRDPAIPVCSGNAPGFYCPPSTLQLSAVMQGTNGINANIDFSVANVESLVAANPQGIAYNNVAGPISSAQMFDWGLPFFYGRRVFVAFEGASTPAGPGPFIAF